MVKTFLDFYVFLFLSGDFKRRNTVKKKVQQQVRGKELLVCESVLKVEN